MEEIENLIKSAREQVGLEKLLKPDLDSYDAAKALKHLGKYDEAINAFLNILSTESNKETDFLSFRQIGDCYFEQKRYNEALELYIRANGSHPEGHDDYSSDMVRSIETKYLNK